MNDCIKKPQNNDVVSFSEPGSSTVAKVFLLSAGCQWSNTCLYVYFKLGLFLLIDKCMVMFYFYLKT